MEVGRPAHVLRFMPVMPANILTVLPIFHCNPPPLSRTPTSLCLIQSVPASPHPAAPSAPCLQAGHVRCHPGVRCVCNLHAPQ